MNSTVKLVVFWFVIVLSAVLMWQVVRSGGNSSQGVPEIYYSNFLSDVESGKVAQITLSKNHVDGRYQDGTLFRVNVPSSQEGMLQTLREHHVNILVRDESSGDGKTTLMNFAPLVLLAVL
jgi:cell division protease FtsH